MKLFPHYSEILLIKDVKKTANYKRSVWYGLTQGVINWPRMFLTNVTKGLLIVFKGVLQIVFGGVVGPILSICSVLILGLLGRVSIIGDKKDEGLEAVRLKTFGAKE